MFKDLLSLEIILYLIIYKNTYNRLKNFMYMKKLDKNRKIFYEIVFWMAFSCFTAGGRGKNK